MSVADLSPLQIWILAARPKTLPAAAAPVIVGVGTALAEGVFRAGPATAALLGALLIQIGTNFANDYFDFQKGADNEARLGPTRVTQAGLLAAREVAAGMWIAFGLASLAGLYLIIQAGWPVLLIGLASILAGIAYTGGPFPFGYHGLGDFFVFVFFGPVAVVGTYFVQSGAASPAAVWSSLPIGSLATAILVVNNLRDIETDAIAGKHTLAVRLGRSGTRLEYLLLGVISYLVPHWDVACRFGPCIGLALLADLPPVLFPASQSEPGGRPGAQRRPGRDQPPGAAVRDSVYRRPLAWLIAVAPSGP